MGEENDDGNSTSGVKLPHERTEINLKKAIFRFLVGNIVFEGEPYLVDKKVRDLTIGLYEIMLNGVR